MSVHLYAGVNTLDNVEKLSNDKHEHSQNARYANNQDENEKEGARSEETGGIGQHLDSSCSNTWSVERPAALGTVYASNPGRESRYWVKSGLRKGLNSLRDGWAQVLEGPECQRTYCSRPSMTLVSRASQ